MGVVSLSSFTFSPYPVPRAPAVSTLVGGDGVIGRVYGRLFHHHTLLVGGFLCTTHSAGAAQPTTLLHRTVYHQGLYLGDVGK
jgi:hypothetical protein